MSVADPVLVTTTCPWKPPGQLLTTEYAPEQAPVPDVVGLGVGVGVGDGLADVVFFGAGLVEVFLDGVNVAGELTPTTGDKPESAGVV